MSDPFTVGVTGAAGYIGGRLVDKLQVSHPEWEIIAIDNFYEGTTRENGDVTVRNVDIRNRDRLETVLGDADVICHLAAVNGVDDCDENPELSYEVNVVGTNHVAWLCSKHTIGLIFPTSMAILGDPENVPITFDQPRDALNWYARTKILGESAVEKFAAGNFPAHVFVKSNLYGDYTVDGERISKGTVINFFIRRARNEQPLTVYEPGTQTRDFVHVGDVARAYVRAIERLDAQLRDGDTGVTHYPIASQEERSVESVANRVQAIAADVGLETEVKLVENPRSRETMVEQFRVDITKTVVELNWKPVQMIEESIYEQLTPDQPGK